MVCNGIQRDESNWQGHNDSLTLAGLMVVVDVCARVLAALLYTQHLLPATIQRSTNL